MKKIVLLKSILLLFISLNTFAQKKAYLVSTIPAELTEDANAVVRNNFTHITIKSVNEMVVKTTRVVTILNKLGDREIDAAVGYDQNRRITKLSAKIYNGLGKEIKKYSKSKFLDVSAVDGGTLYSDSRIKYLDYTPTEYPYTLVFETEYKSTSTGFIPNWNPLSSYYLGIEKSSYSLINTSGIPINKKEKNFDGYTISNNSDDNNLYYNVENIVPIKYENYSPGINSVRPKLLVNLTLFVTDGVAGNYKNWNEFGLWMNTKILSGKNIINESTKSMIRKMVDSAKTDIEKAKIVYKYMQDKTRYISVQVGIGGIQPIIASEVDKVGYGDCKGLTNYTKALLEVVGVKSNYVHVEANQYDNISFENDFASLEQGNHAILNIPNNGNDVWLECTSQINPFGFLGDFTDNRDVLVMTPEGGVIKRTPAYLNEDNLQVLKAEVILDEEGNVKTTLVRISKGIQYDDKFHYENFTEEDLIKRYKSEDWSYNNNLEVENLELINDKENIVFTENLKLTIGSYASLNQGEYLFRANVLNKINGVPKRYRNRKMPLKITRGYKDIEELTIKLPKGYALNILPESKKIDTKFGSYNLSYEKLDEETLLYKRTILIKAGEHPKEEYKAYRKFRKKTAKLDNQRIALTKI
jgi:hypothetical protein